MSKAYDDYLEALYMQDLEREAHFDVYLRNTVWHANDGRILEVSEMTPDHARNALAWSLQRYPHMKKRIEKSVLGKALAERGQVETDVPVNLPGYVTAKALDDIETAANAGAMEVAEPKKGQRVLVEAYLPHVAQYGWNPNLSLVYGWPGGPLEVGDLVSCPGTDRKPSGWVAIVVNLDASGHPYKGPVRMLLGKAKGKS